MFGIGQSEAILIFLIGGGIYLLPTIFAHHRKHEKAVAITLLSLFLGWTLIVWVACFIWAFSGRQAAVAGTTKTCPYCKGSIPIDAQKCQRCTGPANFIEADAAQPRLKLQQCVSCGATNRIEYLTCVGCGAPLPT